jgi:hypothetical protein
MPLGRSSAQSDQSGDDPMTADSRLRFFKDMGSITVA